MVSILGYNAWKDVNCFDTVVDHQSFENMTLQNIKFRGVSLVEDIDSTFNTCIPQYDAGHTVVNSNFKYSVTNSIIKQDYIGINKIIIYRWIPYSEQWAKINEFTITSNNWDEPNLEAIRTVTKDTSLVTSVVKYKIEYYKWKNSISVLSEEDTKYIELNYTLQSNFISDKDECFPLFINVNMTQDRNQDAAILQPLSRKYPVIIKNSATNYNSGTFSAMLMTEDVLNKLRHGEGYNIQAQESMMKFKNDVINFLSNGKTKCLRIVPGDMFIVNITGGISVDWIAFGSGYNCQISFNWIEVADSNSIDAVEKVQFTY